FFFSSRRRHTRFSRDWSSDVCSSDLFTSAEDVARLRGYANVVVNVRPFPSHLIDTRIGLEVIREDDGRIGLDSRVSGVASGDSVVPLRQWLRERADRKRTADAEQLKTTGNPNTHS